MDEIVSYFDGKILEPRLPHVITAVFPEGTLMRQIFCLEVILIFGAIILYFVSSSFTYWLYFKHLKEKYHPATEPQPYPGQIRDEITISLWALPLMGQLMCPFFLGHIRGYAKLYENFSDYGWLYFCVSVILLLIWSDTLIYWIHREEHDVKYLYKNYHKLHHKFKVTTPYACFAFHPFDGFVQAFPYLLFPYLFPMQKWFYITSFLFLQVHMLSLLLVLLQSCWAWLSV